MKYLSIILTLLSSSICFAHRDLETGTFLPRDLIGYSDGPSVYCYVNCNPIYAVYEAYEPRPVEWSDGTAGNPDRQMANTKEEEAELGLLNEGMRYRDLETGTFLTRDPIRYADGPNMYCYVHCNPITSFDPLGLWAEDGNGGFEWDGQLDIETPDGEEIVDFRKIKDYIDKADKDGNVTLNNGYKTTVEALNRIKSINDEIESSAKDKSRKADKALLEDGHMSLEEAKESAKEVVNTGKVTMMEHYCTRKVMNNDRELEAFVKENRYYFVSGWADRITSADGEVWKTTVWDAFHGPNNGAGVKKWVSNRGREIIISREGDFEKRDEYLGTYNFVNPKWYGPGQHKPLDMVPYDKRGWGNTPDDTNFIE